MRTSATILLATAVATLALHGTGSGQAYSVYGAPRLFVTGDTSPGGTLRMVYSSPFDKSKSFMLLYSSATTNPYVLPDGRSLGLNVFMPGNAAIDPIFWFTSVNGLGAETWFGTPLPQQGTLDIVGTGTRSVLVYNSPALHGLTIYCVALTLDAGSPSGIERISNVAAITFRNASTPIHYVRIENLPGVPLWSGSQSGAVGDIMQGTTSGICRIKAASPPPPGKGGLPEHTEMFEVRGWNNGQNGVSENGGGDDVNLGPVPCNWTKSYANNNVGVIDANTGMFTAGYLASTANNGVTGAYGTITATLSGNPGITATKQIRVVPPSWVSPPLAAPAGLAAQVVGCSVNLSWTNPINYTAIDIQRNGVTVVSNLPGTTTSWTDPSNASGTYGVRGKSGGSTSAWSTINVANVAAPQNVTGQTVSSQVVLNWTNPVVYTSIDIQRNGSTIATGLPGTATTFTDVNNGNGAYGVRGNYCGNPTSWSTVNVGQAPLSLGDDTNVAVSIGFPFTYYGTVYNTMYVSSNGNITFGSGNNTYQESLSALAAAPPRICGLWDDLNPGTGGQVLSTPSASSHRIDFVGVPEYGSSNSNSFWIEIRSNGQVQIGWTSVAILDAIVGIGNGSSSAAEINFSSVVLPYNGAANARICEQFTGGGDPFDLNGQSRTFTPSGSAYIMTSP